MMTITQFQALHKIEQEEQVTVHGTFLLNYYDDDHLYDVYKLYRFFVRVSYNELRDELWAIVAMTGTDDVFLYEHDLFPFSGN